jgi:glutaconate CoA-transferase subunit A
MYSMVQAGSMGLPFIGVRGLLGSDLLRQRPDLKVEGNPFHPGEEVVVVPPIRPDVAVFHALQADRWGNAITAGLRDDLMMARAARRVVVTTEEITAQELTLQDAVNNTFLPAIHVDGVVHAHCGAHPCRCGPLYPADAVHIKEYLNAAKGEETFRAYLDKYVYSVSSQQEYLQKAGVAAFTCEGNRQ